METTTQATQPQHWSPEQEPFGGAVLLIAVIAVVAWRARRSEARARRNHPAGRGR